MKDECTHDSIHPGQTCLEAELEDRFSEATPEQVLELFKTVERWTDSYCKVCGKWNNPHQPSRHCEHSEDK